MSTENTVQWSDLTGVSSMADLWTETIEIWQHGFMGVDIGRILIGLSIFIGFLIIRGIFSKYVINQLNRLSKNTSSNMDDKIIHALSPPIKFIPVLLGLFVAGRYAGLDDAMGDVFGNIMRSLIAFTIFWTLYRGVEPLSYAFSGFDRVLTPTMANWLYRVVRILLLFIGAAIILEFWGIKIGPLLAGLGLFGAAVALGAQDLFKNLIGGATVIAEKRFSPGEWIKVDGVVEGTVEDIGFRSTRIRRFDQAPVHVPNAQLSDAAVTNFSRMTHRRIYWMIGVEYRTSVEQLQIIRDEILAYLKEHEDTFDLDITTFVRIDSFGASSIDILVYCFTRTTRWGEWLEIKEALAFALKEIVEEKAGTGFAFPSQSLYIESWPGDAPEIFTPPSEKAA